MTIRNSEANTPITMPGFRQREQAAKDRRERNTVAPEVREARAALLQRREEAMAADDEAETRKASRPVEAFREVLALAPDSLLEELERSIVRLASRQMSDTITEVLVDRRRARHAADIAPPPEVAPMPEAAVSPARGRRTASATSAAA